MKLPIYLDNHATTQVDPRVVEAMLPYFSEKFGNAASRQHKFGWVAEEGVETARSFVAKFLNAEPNEIIFTSGATESNNLAVKGVAESYKQKGNHIISCVTEHHSVLDVCKSLEKSGCEVSYLRVDKYGRINLEELANAIRQNTILVSIMFANNEIGTLQPIEEIGKLCVEHGIVFHTDATQAIGKIPIDVLKMDIHLLSLSAHKIYGPKGIGVLYVRKKNPRVSISPILHGGGQEKNLRSGTLNVPSIVGLGKAIDICANEIKIETERISFLRNLLQRKIFETIPNVWLNGESENRIPNNLNIGFDGVDAEALMMGLKEIAVSSGSACSTSQAMPSHVLKAIGLSSDEAHSCIRFGVGRFNTEEEIEYVAKRVGVVVEQLRSISPKYKVRKQKEELVSI
ncbi:MAG: IscS subfamily cysteine desulfurase [Ignavibacteriales bacterium]|nr:IscS subfamily cysteine desulfurase [Ignavibacteriales bacterium]